MPSDDLRVDVGDDCAVIDLKDPSIAVSTDMLVENVHFNLKPSEDADD